MQRRNFLQGAITVGIGVLVSERFAWAHHESSPTAVDPKLQAVIDGAYDCVRTGENCISHCARMLGEGMTEMKECSESAHNLVAVCTAMWRAATYATASPAALKHLAASCEKFCSECAAACRKHAEHHDFCKTCLESCEKCAKACNAYATS